MERGTPDGPTADDLRVCWRRRKWTRICADDEHIDVIAERITSDVLSYGSSLISPSSLLLLLLVSCSSLLVSPTIYYRLSSFSCPRTFDCPTSSKYNVVFRLHAHNSSYPASSSIFTLPFSPCSPSDSAPRGFPTLLLVLVTRHSSIGRSSMSLSLSLYRCRFIDSLLFPYSLPAHTATPRYFLRRTLDLGLTLTFDLRPLTFIVPGHMDVVA